MQNSVRMLINDVVNNLKFDANLKGAIDPTINISCSNNYIKNDFIQSLGLIYKQGKMPKWVGCISHFDLDDLYDFDIDVIYFSKYHPEYQDFIRQHSENSINSELNGYFEEGLLNQNIQPSEYGEINEIIEAELLSMPSKNQIHLFMQDFIGAYFETIGMKILPEDLKIATDMAVFKIEENLRSLNFAGFPIENTQNDVFLNSINIGLSPINQQNTFSEPIKSNVFEEEFERIDKEEARLLNSNSRDEPNAKRLKR
jgi:hypothetical protein